MPDLDLPPIERLQAVMIQPGDVIIATAPEGTTDQDLDEILAQLTRFFTGHKVLVIAEGLSLSVQRPEEDSDGEE